MFRIFSVIVMFMAALAPMRASADQCYASWSVAAPIVHKERLTTVEKLSKLAQSRISGNIIKTTLCHEKGAFTYRLIIRDPAGRLMNRTVDARTPFDR
jgi:uncharacterized membrane protein YkoI